jgi:hypothetical protein
MPKLQLQRATSCSTPSTKVNILQQLMITTPNFIQRSYSDDGGRDALRYSSDGANLHVILHPRAVLRLDTAARPIIPAYAERSPATIHAEDFEDDHPTNSAPAKRRRVVPVPFHLRTTVKGLHQAKEQGVSESPHFDDLFAFGTSPAGICGDDLCHETLKASVERMETEATAAGNTPTWQNQFVACIS